MEAPPATKPCALCVKTIQTIETDCSYCRCDLQAPVPVPLAITPAPPTADTASEKVLHRLPASCLNRWQG
jgi:hypothetical protein